MRLLEGVRRVRAKRSGPLGGREAPSSEPVQMGQFTGQVAAVIPALNEEGTIVGVVRTLQSNPYIGEVIVVSDGSSDQTAAQAREAGAKVLEHQENRGKAGAMKTGMEATSSPVILFLDGDLTGLTQTHVESLLRPTLAGEADMTVGIFDGGRMATDLAQVVSPYLSGQRSIRREIVDDMFRQEPDAAECRFGIEVALTRFVIKRGYHMANVPLEGMSHRMKEEKMGLVEGVTARLRMYHEILQYVRKDWTEEKP